MTHAGSVGELLLPAIAQPFHGLARLLAGDRALRTHAEADTLEGRHVVLRRGLETLQSDLSDRGAVREEDREGMPADVELAGEERAPFRARDRRRDRHRRGGTSRRSRSGHRPSWSRPTPRTDPPRECRRRRWRGGLRIWRSAGNRRPRSRPRPSAIREPGCRSSPARTSIGSSAGGSSLSSSRACSMVMREIFVGGERGRAPAAQGLDGAQAGRRNLDRLEGRAGRQNHGDGVIAGLQLGPAEVHGSGLGAAAGGPERRHRVDLAVLANLHLKGLVGIAPQTQSDVVIAASDHGEVVRGLPGLAAGVHEIAALRDSGPSLVLRGGRGSSDPSRRGPRRCRRRSPWPSGCPRNRGFASSCGPTRSGSPASAAGPRTGERGPPRTKPRRSRGRDFSWSRGGYEGMRILRFQKTKSLWNKGKTRINWRKAERSVYANPLVHLKPTCDPTHPVT